MSVMKVLMTVTTPCDPNVGSLTQPLVNLEFLDKFRCCAASAPTSLHNKDILHVCDCLYEHYCDIVAHCWQDSVGLAHRSLSPAKPL